MVKKNNIFKHLEELLSILLLYVAVSYHYKMHTIKKTNKQNL